MSHPMFDLTGRVALVTGSSRGIGLAVAEAFIESGATVVLNGRDAGRLEAAAETLRSRGHAPATAVFDVADDTSVAEGVAAVEAEHGRIDILVNNAGFQRRALLEDVSPAQFRQMLDVHMTGAFMAAKAAAPGMIARRAGKIINVCSLASEVGRANITPYSAAKGGLKMLTKGMAVEWARHNIQVNGIGPGYIRTEMNTELQASESFNRMVDIRVPAQRWGQPQELAGAAIFLASAASDYMTGQILYVDGGLLSQI